jgi:LPS-assembly protein
MKIQYSLSMLPLKKFRRRFNLEILGWLILLCGSSLFWSDRNPADAADLEKFFQNDSAAPWRIEADRLTYDKATDQTTASGNAILQKNDFRLSADEVRYNRTSLAGEAEGHVRVSSGEDWLTGERMEMDLSNRIGTIYNATLFLRQNNYHVTGGKIQKTSENSYSGEDVTVSTCDGDSPAWVISGKKLDVTIEGYGFVEHATFRVKDIPILYTPFFAFPVKTKRQTGLLFPEFGISDRKGAEIVQPFFWAINDSSDATFYEHYMNRRGNKFGLEYRFMLDEKARGTLMFDWLDDRKVDNGSGTTSADYGYTDDGVLRPNSDRYWFRMKLDQPLPFDVTAQLGLDIVSDQDYLHEFKGGFCGFQESASYFEKYFGRDLDDYNDPVRTNRLNFNRLWSSVSANAEFRWMDDVIARRQNGKDETVQRLPSISIDSTRQSVLNMPFYIGLDSEYAYLYRKDGTRAHRMDINPRLYLPYRFGTYLSMEPSVGLQETVWNIDKTDASIGDADRTLNRNLYDFRLDFSSEVYKVYPSGTDGEGRLKHLMRFQVVYDYLPELNQNEYPQFDALDRIGNQNLITYSWIHSFTSRSIVHPAGAENTAEYDYHQLARVKLEQSYDIFKENENIPEPFSPITAEIELDVTPEVYLKADTGWSTYNGEFVSHDIACGLKDHRGDEFFIERRYAKDKRETIYTDVLLRATSWLWFYADFERNLLASKDIEKGIGVSYQAQCWSFDVRYSKEDDNHEVAFTISLFGLGDFGSGARKPGTLRYLEALRSTNKISTGGGTAQ